ncbi:hypothetical protein IVB14_05110 [Bradyrhizobium sp. 180]|uniref:hypothetical protein n=1 Tax=unclassified Bradyrhizobium TaxID=2631580 RepID=UPI001FF8ECFE|nr:MULTISPECIES: hypothetical protein [unclassified Bradyrhizobium]MCK1420705.1 hypothetical protein [Bradyrhizobium sp. CW12]MCK1489816.1 hypothetical protein [Bradyrhizobium sp. 180]MCK1532400.1 hypothetical protein [Bradyrhizobium sp. 182]MCK1595636.1 hypothetical protein [Bradyrhizobium sp. 164]MCK1618421.1 hypothetical protein [Bradyrhizobium sp. 159]
MSVRPFANAVVMLLVAAGLLLAPLATPASAMPVSGAVASMPAMSDDTQGMSEDMPCCPDQTKSKACGSCPFVALCMLSLSLSAPFGASTMIERQPQRSALAPRNDRLRDGLAAKPPDHPPRTRA